MSKVNIIGSKITATCLDEAVTALECLIKRGKACYICFSNAHTLVEGRKSKEFMDITNNAAMALADGMPLVWVQRMAGCKSAGRCAGPDFMDESLKKSIRKGYSHYFVGWSVDTLDLLVKKLVWNYPELKVVGTGIVGTGKGQDSWDEDIVKDINTLRPDIVWIGLGFPNQEKWMYEHVKKIESVVLIGVGAAFNFHAGIVKRAPRIMQRLGLEWFYRLIKEPGRLWKRYIVTNTLFIYYLLISVLKSRSLKVS